MSEGERKAEKLEFNDPIGSLNYFLDFPWDKIPFISREQESEIEKRSDPEEIARLAEHNRNLHIRARLYSALDAIKIFAEEHLDQSEATHFIDQANTIIAVYNEEVEVMKREHSGRDFSQSPIRMPLIRHELVLQTRQLLQDLKQKLIEKEV